jgi:hypothetical protein
MRTVVNASVGTVVIHWSPDDDAGRVCRAMVEAEVRAEEEVWDSQ